MKIISLEIKTYCNWRWKKLGKGPLIETDDRDMLEQTLYCHFFENLRVGVLFHVWKQAAFRYIAYTDGMDYEIPIEIILQHSNYLTDSDWKRIEQYSYAASIRKTKQK